MCSGSEIVIKFGFLILNGFIIQQCITNSTYHSLGGGEQVGKK